LALAILVQFYMFRHRVQRSAALVIPTGYDQAVYLAHSYRVYEVMVERGVAEGLRFGANLPVANGLFLHLHAAVIFLLLGPSRQSALLVNFLWFAAFQVALLATLQRRSGRWSVALYGVGLLLAVGVPFSLNGGMTDFRIDFVAFNLFGIFLCAAVRSDFFASRRWSLAAGAAAAVLVLYRHLTAVYLAGIFAVSAVSFAARAWRHRRDAAARAGALRRLGAVVLAGGIAAAVAAPVIVARGQMLWDYYVVNTVINEDKDARAAEFGVATRAQSLLFYTRSVQRDHAGWAFLALAAAGVAAAWWLRRHGPPRGDGRAAWLVLGACLLVPYLVLTPNVSKSPVVGSIMLPPLLWLCLWPVVRVADRRARLGRRAAWSLAALATLVFASGLYLQVRRSSRPHPGDGPPADQVAALAALYDTIIGRCRAAGLYAPVLSCDTINPYFCAPVLSVVACERHQFGLHAFQALGDKTLAVDEAQVRRFLRDSDFLILTDGPLLGMDCYPFQQSVRALRPVLEERAAAMETVGEFRLGDSRLVLYARPAVAQAEQER
jgi:hypothetical protein